jgi:hypothetical protein
MLSLGTIPEEKRRGICPGMNRGNDFPHPPGKKIQAPSRLEFGGDHLPEKRMEIWRPEEHTQGGIRVFVSVPCILPEEKHRLTLFALDTDVATGSFRNKEQ